MADFAVIPRLLQQTFLVAASSLALAGCATTPPSGHSSQLDTLIVFADPAMCEFTDQTRKLIHGFYIGDPTAVLEDTWIQPGAVPDHLRDRFGPITRIKHDGWWTIRTETRGSLRDLPLVAIAHGFPEGGAPGDITFEFAGPMKTVERAAHARGFTARAGRSVQMGVPDGYAYEISLHPGSHDGNRSYLSCGAY